KSLASQLILLGGREESIDEKVQTYNKRANVHSQKSKGKNNQVFGHHS
ncbi:4442_t:CDS:1, partial [Acaulospora morrowiae]